MFLANEHQALPFRIDPLTNQHQGGGEKILIPF